MPACVPVNAFTERVPLGGCLFIYLFMISIDTANYCDNDIVLTARFRQAVDLQKQELRESWTKMDYQGVAVRYLHGTCIHPSSWTKESLEAFSPGAGERSCELFESKTLMCLMTFFARKSDKLGARKMLFRHRG